MHSRSRRWMRAAMLAVFALAACGPEARKQAPDPTRASTSVTIGAITVENASVRPPPGGVTTGAGYMTVRNAGAEPDRLLGASSPHAAAIELHTHREVDGVMRMERVETVDIPGGGEVRFATGGLHLMLFGFVPAGAQTPVTLRFERAGEVTVGFVAPAGAARKS